ncbi:MAG: DUF3445 domain-containing protein, partial [Mesorhizobium sp.]
EVLDLLAAHLLEFPETHRLGGSGIEVVGAASRLPAALAEAPLARASLLVQEDLILMRRGDSGWRLVAGSLCFPSS